MMKQNIVFIKITLPNLIQANPSLRWGNGEQIIPLCELIKYGMYINKNRYIIHHSQID